MFRFLLFLALSLLTLAAEPTPRQIQVGGLRRDFLLHAPAGAKEKPTPLVFAFHGHGGSMRNAARSFHLHAEWPEALVVYPQGLPTPGQLTDPEGKRSGWQGNVGLMEDRDLRFFDALLAGLKQEFKVDARRIYSTGHSNGGGFTYLLLAHRAEHFAAMAPSASAALKQLPKLQPKPVLHIASESDPLVKYAWQSRTIDWLKQLNQCGEGKAWPLEPHCTIYESKIGAPVLTALHGQGHKYPDQAPAVIVKFFKQHALPEPQKSK